MLFSVASFSQDYYAPSSTGAIYNTFNDPTYGYAEDGNRATVLYSAMPASQDYGSFSIPDLTGVTVYGIGIYCGLYHNNTSGYTHVYVEISGDGGSTWTSTGNQGVTTELWTLQSAFVGGSGDLWGETWSASNFTDANFKVRLTFVNDGSTWYSELDYVLLALWTSSGSGPVANDTLYFDPTVVGSTQEGTQENPIIFGTILENAIEAADPGTVFMLADTTYYGSLSISGASGASGNPIKITTWHKYTTTRKFKLSGYKTVTGFTQVGNNWRLTDTDLPNSYRSSAGDDYPNYILLRNFLRINGKNYAVSRYPNTGYLTAENWSTASPPTYLYDNTALNDNYDGSLMDFIHEEWGITRTKLNASGNYLYFESGYSSVDLSQFYRYNAGAGRYPKYVLSNLEYLNDANGDFAYNPETHQLSVYWTGSSLNSQKVEYPTFNYLLRLNNCSYVTVDSIEFYGGSVAQVYIDGGDHINVTNNRFVNCPGWAGIIASYCTAPTVSGNVMTDGIGSGINIRNCSDPVANDNVILRMGVIDVMNPDQLDGPGNGIYLRSNTGDHEMIGNIVDSSCYGGIVDRVSDGTTSIFIENNVVLNSMLNLNDGGAIYTFEPMDLGNFTRSIRRNYVNGSFGSAEYTWAGGSSGNGIYLDGGAEHYDVDSNVVIRTNSGINLNGTDQNDIGYNIIYNNTTRPDYSAGIRGQQYGHWEPTTDCYFHHNTIIQRDSTNEHGIFWVTDVGTLTNYGTVSDYNSFFTPFFTSSEYIGGTYNFSSVTRRSRSGFNSLFGWESHSTWNKSGWDYQQVSGITRDQFVWIYYNWSSAPHYFDLGFASFRLGLDGSVISDSVLVGPYEHKALFYYTGSLDGVENPLFLGESTPAPVVPDPGTPTYEGNDSLGINFTTASFLKYRWNNITDPTQVTVTPLIYLDGTASPYTLTSEDVWGFGTGANGYYPGVFPDSVQRTNFIADDGNWKNLTISGLDPNHYYTFQVLGSRINNGEVRRVVYKIGNDSILVTVTDNASTLATFDYIQPTDGSITLSCRRNLGPYAYINGIKILEYVLPQQAAVRKINNRVIFIRYF